MTLGAESQVKQPFLHDSGQICVTSFMSGPFVNLTPGEDKLLMINKQDRLKMIDDHQFIEKVNQCCIFLKVFGCCTLQALVKICIFKKKLC